MTCYITLNQTSNSQRLPTRGGESQILPTVLRQPPREAAQMVCAPRTYDRLSSGARHNKKEDARMCKFEARAPLFGRVDG